MRTHLLTILIFVAGIFGCTIGFVSGDITTDGMPVIFKVRDIDGWNIEYKRVQPAYQFAYAAHSWTTSSTAWMGINEHGFGVVQSASANFSGGSSLENGIFMTHALKNCVSIADFDSLVEYTDTLSRYTLANYIVFDITGDAALYEMSNDTHAVYYPDTSGMLVRTNFSYIGNTERPGWERMVRAKSLLLGAKGDEVLDAEWICRNLIGYLHRDGIDPYPLPFTGQFGDLPTGVMDTDTAGNRTIASKTTVAASVIVNPPAGGDPQLSHMYCYFAHPAVSVPFVMFPNSEESPPYVTGLDSPMFTLSKAKRDSAFYSSSDEGLFDTWVLLDTTGGGIDTYKQHIEDWVFDTVATFLSGAAPSSAMLTEFQDTVITRVYNWYRDGEISLGMAEPVDIPDGQLHIRPNPFNSHASINSDIDGPVHVYTLEGRMITTLYPPVNWQVGKDIPSGILLFNQPGARGTKAALIR